MTGNFELSEDDIRTAIVNHISSKYGVDVNRKFIKLWVKSKQNYKSEWEEAAFKGAFSGDIE